MDCSIPPALVQLYHERLKPGAEAAYSRIEEDVAEVCARLKCPNPYLALESVAGPKEVWWLNAFASEADRGRVERAYEQNVEMMAALRDVAQRKQGLVHEPETFLATYRSDLSLGCAWRIAGVWSERSEDPLARLHAVEARSHPAPPRGRDDVPTRASKGGER